jgi:hypothetical protein
MFINVLLPAPFSPTMPKISPGCTVKLTSLRAGTPKKLFVILSNSRIGRAIFRILR